jgi:hypothetical protein
MPVYYINHECNGHRERCPRVVELGDFAEASAYALSRARFFQDLVPGESRECAFEVRDAATGLSLKLELSFCLECPGPATEDVDGGLL